MVRQRTFRLHPAMGRNYRSTERPADSTPVAAEEDTSGVNHKARRSRVPRAGSRPQCRLSREATGPYIARTATTRERETAAAAAAAAAAGIDGNTKSLFPLLVPIAIGTGGRRLCKAFDQGIA